MRMTAHRLLGILLVSITTAIITNKLSLTQNETELLKYSEVEMQG